MLGCSAGLSAQNFLHVLRTNSQIFPRCVVRISLSVLTLIFSVDASADDSTYRVYRDQYIVDVSPPHGTFLSEAAADAMLHAAGATVIKSLGHGARLVRPSVETDLVISSSSTAEVIDYEPSQDLCIALMKDGVVRSCSPNYELKISRSPNDSTHGSVWGLNELEGINGPSAWDRTTGSDSVVVAIIDTGVDYTHNDLAENIWTNPGEVAGNGVDDDHNGYIDDVHGINAITRSGNPYDDNGHGTHVAGTIGAIGNNGRGVAGINWRTSIMGLKFLSATGSGSLAGAIEAINYMVLMKSRGVNVRVSNNSWGGGGYSQALLDAIGRANTAGIIFVAAAGNEANDNDANPSYPANYDVANVVSVAAVDRNRNMASFSNYGAATVDIAAPGVQILSTYPGNGYQILSGTSMATPHVTGAIALLLANEPWLNIGQVTERLYLSGFDLSSLDGVVRSGRMLNAARLIHGQTSQVPAPAPTPEPCRYEVQQIAYAPATAMADLPAVIQADEFNFYRVDLPFSFNFFREAVSTIYISPNGVVYTKAQPSVMDYLNSDRAPLSSIAALHADLTTQNAPFGVRVQTDGSKVTILWYAETYSRRGLGSLKAWLTIHADGTIDDMIEASDSATFDFVRNHATIGITGSYAANLKTYTANGSTQLSDPLALRFVPACDSTTPPDSGSGPVTISRISIRGQGGHRVEPGKKLRIALNGNGNGQVSLTAAFNNRLCPSGLPITVTDGAASLRARLPMVPEHVSQLKIRVGDVKRSTDIRRARFNRRGHPRRITDKRLAGYCTRFFSSLSDT